MERVNEGMPVRHPVGSAVLFCTMTEVKISSETKRQARWRRKGSDQVGPATIGHVHVPQNLSCVRLCSDFPIDHSSLTIER